MKCVRWIVLTIIGVAVLGVVVVATGLVPATASSGHWPITAWGLEFAMERSVSTHSSGITPPPLDNAALVMRGAAHFEVGCAWCHGQPGSAPGRLVMHMTPHPSDLREELEKWSERELFYIVRHGVKFTGMPAWPSADRDDEVWGLVAFLSRFRSMDTGQYQELAGLNEVQSARQQQRLGKEIPEVIVGRCVSCHSVDGQGRAAFPALAGQKREYLVTALNSYRSAARPSGTMGPIAAGLLTEEIEQAAEYYAQQPARQQSIKLTEAEHATASRLVHHGEPRQRIGACGACHPLNTIGAKSSVTQHYPNLNGQRVDYLIGQLHLFRSQVRGGGPQHHIMHNMVEELSDEQLRCVAKLYGSTGTTDERK